MWLDEDKVYDVIKYSCDMPTVRVNVVTTKTTKKWNKKRFGNILAQKKEFLSNIECLEKTDSRPCP